MMNNRKADSVSVVIPTKNEAGSIAKVIEGVRPHCDQIIVVDGSSTDGTAQIAAGYPEVTLLQDSGRGKGEAIIIGINDAKGDIIVLIDSDGSHDPADIPRLVEPIIKGEADMIIGSRLLGGSDEIHGNLTNYLRMVGAGFITLLINLRYKSELTDVLNGFKAITKEAAWSLDLRSRGFEIEQEMVVKALKKGYRVKEIASHEFCRASGHSKLPTYKGLMFIFRLFVDMVSG